MAELKDSGERRKFETGAVRDIAEGKGRTDLLPLVECAKYLDLAHVDHESRDLLEILDLYIYTGDVNFLYGAVMNFCTYENIGAYTMLLELSKHYEDGAKKYEERNWMKGIPLHCFIDSGIRHYLKYKRGDKDEPHDRAFLWNIFGAIWTHKNKPEMIDLPFSKENNHAENDSD